MSEPRVSAADRAKACAPKCNRCVGDGVVFGDGFRPVPCPSCNGAGVRNLDAIRDAIEAAERAAFEAGHDAGYFAGVRRICIGAKRETEMLADALKRFTERT